MVIETCIYASHCGNFHFADIVLLGHYMRGNVYFDKLEKFLVSDNQMHVGVELLVVYLSGKVG